MGEKTLSRLSGRKTIFPAVWDEKLSLNDLGGKNSFPMILDDNILSKLR
jgi:hypothetical protein